MEQKIPTLTEFNECCKQEFQFLVDMYSFEVKPSEDEFKFVYEGKEIDLVIRGEMYGTAASVHLRDKGGIEVPEIIFVPTEDRPSNKKRYQQKGQLSEIKQSADIVRTYCGKVLSGDMQEFRDKASRWP